MAFYTYKLVCHVIPDRYVDEAFEQKYGEEFDGDANYNGDYWVAASDWIDDLQEEANRLRAGLEHLECLFARDSEVVEAIRKLLEETK